MAGSPVSQYQLRIATRMEGKVYMMTDGSLQMFASWLKEQGLDGSSLRTSEDFLPLTTETLSPESVQKWPTEVSSDGSGALYMRPKSERLIAGTDGSVLLPTPRAAQGDKRNQRVWERPLDKPQNLENALARLPLLPTPTARDYKDRGKGMNWNHAWKKRRLPGVVMMELYEDGKQS